MKFFIISILMFSVLADFSIGTYDMASCDESSICSDTHIDGQDTKTTTSDNHECHSHVGHSHLAIIVSHFSDLVSETSDLAVQFPKYKVQNINFFLNEISRPPIS